MPNKLLDADKIASRVNLIRIRNGYTQEQFARVLGISQAAVSKYLNNRIPSPAVLLTLSRIGNTTIEWILTGGKSYFYAHPSMEVRETYPGGYDAEGKLAAQIAGLPADIRSALQIFVDRLAAGKKQE